MDGDFEGELHDVERKPDDQSGGDSEEGDDERLQQQMGEDLGDNQEVGPGILGVVV